LQDRLYTDRYKQQDLPWIVAAEGIKRTSILTYLACLGELKRMDFVDENFISVILIDEIEQGLHPPKQRAIVEMIKKYTEDIRKNIKLIISTHSPIIWREFIKIYNKNPEIIDIFYVFRTEGGSTGICRKGEAEADEQEKILEIELGFSLYEMPRVVIFCEGGTDEEFLKGILEREVEERKEELSFNLLEEVDIYECEAPYPSNVIEDQLKRRRPISYTRKVLFVGDKDQEEGRKKKIEELNKIAKDFEIKDISFAPKNLEHFIFGEAKDDSDQIENIKSVLRNLLNHCSENDKRKIEGLLKIVKEKRWDYEKIKKHKEIYRIIGRYWREVLSQEKKETLKEIIDFIEN